MTRFVINGGCYLSRTSSSGGVAAVSLRALGGRTYSPGSPERDGMAASVETLRLRLYRLHPNKLRLAWETCCRFIPSLPPFP